MAKAYLFNPENDIALAHGTPNFTAPKQAAALHRAGALLPLWMASKGDVVIAPKAPLDWVRTVARGVFEREADVVSDLANATVHSLSPWGWSPHALRQFEEAHAPGALTEAIRPRLESYRRLSHRRTSTEVIRILSERLPYPPPPLPFEAKSREEAESRIDALGGEVFVKAPWSSTGRGVLSSASATREELMRRIEGIIRHQGSVMVEKALRKRQDFAMLFRCDNGSCDFLGYSLFYNENAQAYGGNLLLPDCRIVEELAQYVDKEALLATELAVKDALSLLIAPHYDGWAGVDMMIYETDTGGFLINPCVEVNLRATMGVLAWHLRRDLLADGCKGIFKIAYGLPPVPDRYTLEGKKLEGGTLNLVPPSEGFSFLLSVEPEK